MLHFAYKLNFKRAERAKWDGRKQDRTNSLEGGAKPDAAPQAGWADGSARYAALQSRKLADGSKLQGTASKRGARWSVNNPRSF